MEFAISAIFVAVLGLNTANIIKQTKEFSSQVEDTNSLEIQMNKFNRALRYPKNCAINFHNIQLDSNGEAYIPSLRYKVIDSKGITKRDQLGKHIINTLFESASPLDQASLENAHDQLTELINDSLPTVSQNSSSTNGGGSGNIGIAAMTSCTPNDQTCSVAAECCSSTCFSDRCTNSTCKPNGQSCNFSSDCCSNDCLGNVCTFNQCSPEGQSCFSQDDCCTGDCTGNVCVSNTCKANGLSCTDPAECCSDNCDSNNVCADLVTCGEEGLQCCDISNGASACTGDLVCGSNNTCINDDVQVIDGVDLPVYSTSQQNVFIPNQVENDGSPAWSLSEREAAITPSFKAEIQKEGISPKKPFSPHYYVESIKIKKIPRSLQNQSNNFYSDLQSSTFQIIVKFQASSKANTRYQEMIRTYRFEAFFHTPTNRIICDRGISLSVINQAVQDSCEELGGVLNTGTGACNLPSYALTGCETANQEYLVGFTRDANNIYNPRCQSISDFGSVATQADEPAPGFNAASTCLTGAPYMLSFGANSINNYGWPEVKCQNIHFENEYDDLFVNTLEEGCYNYPLIGWDFDNGLIMPKCLETTTTTAATTTTTTTTLIPPEYIAADDTVSGTSPGTDTNFNVVTNDTVEASCEPLSLTSSSLNNVNVSLDGPQTFRITPINPGSWSFTYTGTCSGGFNDFAVVSGTTTGASTTTTVLAAGGSKVCKMFYAEGNPFATTHPDAFPIYNPTPPSSPLYVLTQAGSGQNVSFRMLLTNPNQGPLSNVTTNLKCPVGMTYVSSAVDGAPGSVYDSSAGLWTIPTFEKTTIPLVSTGPNAPHGLSLTCSVPASGGGLTQTQAVFTTNYTNYVDGQISEACKDFTPTASAGGPAGSLEIFHNAKEARIQLCNNPSPCGIGGGGGGGGGTTTTTTTTVPSSCPSGYNSYSSQLGHTDIAWSGTHSAFGYKVYGLSPSTLSIGQTATIANNMNPTIGTPPTYCPGIVTNPGQTGCTIGRTIRHAYTLYKTYSNGLKCRKNFNGSMIRKHRTFCTANYPNCSCGSQGINNPDNTWESSVTITRTSSGLTVSNSSGYGGSTNLQIEPSVTSSEILFSTIHSAPPYYCTSATGIDSSNAITITTSP